jgi:hypothetical protein
MAEQTKAPKVEVGCPGANGMAHVTVQLLAKSVENAPHLASRLRGSFCLVTTDYRTGVTVRFEGATVLVDGERDEAAWLQIEGPAMVLAKLAGGDHGLATPKSQGIKVRGLARHPLFAWRLRKLLMAG